MRKEGGCIETELEEDDVDVEAESEEEAVWLNLKVNNEYGIRNYFPYLIRKKINGKIIKETINKTNGYIQVTLNGKTFQKHILVAKQFIYNDDPSNEIFVDHINHNKNDFHISNLRWVTPSENMKNRSSTRGIEYEYVNNIPNDATKVESYGKHNFEDYFFSQNNFYFSTGINYRKLHICENKSGSKYVYMNNTEGKKIQILISKFKSERDIG